MPNARDDPRDLYALIHAITRRVSYTDWAPTLRPTISQGAKSAGLLLVSDHGPLDPTNSAIVDDTKPLQTRQCRSNNWAVQEAIGNRIDKFASATVILVDEAEFAGMN